MRIIIYDQGSIPGRDKGFLFQPLFPDWLWCPPSLLSNGHWGVLSLGVMCGQDVMLTTHPHLALRSMSRSYTSSPHKRLHDVKRDFPISLILFTLLLYKHKLLRQEHI
jgi:hypothetical protein